MANNRLSMRKITEVLRLFFEHSRSKREIARIIGASPSTVTDYLSRAKLAGLAYPLPPDLDEAALERRLFPPSEPSVVQRPEPDWVAVHTSLRRKGVTLELLWQEYKAEQTDGFQYSAFCEHYRRWRQHLSLSMRQTHTPGERLFIDYAGQTVEIIDMHSGEIRHAQIFVAVLGASNYTYLEATWSQQLPDWIGSHVRALDFFGGVTELWVPDNLRSGISKASRYEPDINPTYQDLASHYEVAVLPARARKPKDKALVSYCTLCGWFNSDKFRSGRAISTALTLDENDIAQRFVETPVFISIAVLPQNAGVSPLVYRRWTDAELGRKLVCVEHATLTQSLITAFKLVGQSNHNDFFVRE